MKVALINMPFAALQLPSLALTQLKSVIDGHLGDRVSTHVLYLNHDFAERFSVSAYQRIAASLEHHGTGLGEWFFRQVAFPELPPNAREYFLRYYPRPNPETETLLGVIREQREDLDGFLDDLISRYRIGEAEVVGLTSMFSQNVACLAMARKIKARRPDAIVVMGGANCEAPMGQAIVSNVPSVDYVFSGPGLKSFLQFLEYVLKGETDRCSTIDGVLSKTNEVHWPARTSGRIQLASTHRPWVRPLGAELDIDTPIELDYGPFLDALDERFPGEDLERVLLFETSRGCWWGERAHCTFCGLNGQSMNYRAMSPERALEQFRTLFRYAPRAQEVRLECVDNIIPKSYLTEVFPHLETPANMSIFYEVKADLDEEGFRVLSEARVTRIQPGIEALATSTLKLMRKGTSAFQNLVFLRNASVYGIWPAWNLLVGFPGEDPQVYEKYLADIPLLIHLPPPSGVFPVRFDRFSPYFVEAEQYGLDLQPLDYYGFAYPFDREALATLAYYFADRNYKASYVTSLLKRLRALQAAVAEWQERWSGSGDHVAPRLTLRRRSEGALVYDSRPGEVAEYWIPEPAARLLERLAAPLKLDRLAPDSGGPSTADLAREIAYLQERGLVFQEGERFVSLVVPERSERQSSARAIPVAEEGMRPAGASA